MIKAWKIKNVKINVQDVKVKKLSKMPMPIMANKDICKQCGRQFVKDPQNKPVSDE